MDRLAPSELLRYIPVQMKARTQAMRDGGRAVTHDDLYVAARNMTDSGSRWKDALLMGYVEGVEEFVQAGLEPTAVGERLNPAAMFEAGLYGAASGMGMSLGRINSKPSNAQQAQARAQWNYMRRTGQELTREEFDAIYKGLTPLERERMAMPENTAEAEEILGHIQFHEGMLRTDRARQSVFGAAVANDFATSNFDAALRNVSPNVDANLILLGRTNFLQVHKDGTSEYVDDPNVATMSAFEVVNSLRKKVVAHEAQLESAKRSLSEATEQDQISRFQAQVDHLTAQVGITSEIFGRVKKIYDNELVKAVDDPGFRGAIDKINNVLHNASTGNWKDMSTQTLLPPEQQELYMQAAELVLSRHPYIDTGSFNRLKMQVSYGMTANNQHASIGVHQGILKPYQGDHDGDRFASIRMAYIEPEMLRDLRLGVTLANPTFDEKLGQDVLEWGMDDPDDEATNIREFSEALWNYESREAETVVDAIRTIAKTLTDRYINPAPGMPFLPADAVDKLLIQFELDVRTGNVKARKNLMNGLLRLSPEKLVAHGSATQVPEGLFLQSLISQEWDKAQQAIAGLGMTTQTAAPSSTERKPADKAYQKQVARRDAVNASQTQSMIGSGDSTRDAQMLWYTSFYRSAVDAMDPAKDSGFITQQQAILTQRFIELVAGESGTAFEKVTDKHSIERRVLNALNVIHKSAGMDAAPEAKILLAQTLVPNLVYNEEVGSYVVEKGEITLLQLLLRGSLQVEKNLRRGMPPDAAINLKIKKLEAMTRAQKEHSYSASTALLEIFGDEQLINLLGGSAKYLGQHLTMRQLLTSIQGMHEINRARDIRGWKSAPAYVSHHGKGDPPYAPSDYKADPNSDKVPLNAFTLVVDALATSANTAFDAMKGRDETAHANMLSLLGSLKTMTDNWAKDFAVRLRNEGKSGNRRAILEDMLEQRQDVASILAPIIPDAIRLGAFEVIEGRVYTANWVMEVLTEPDLEKAALIYHVYSGFTEYNLLGGGIDIDSLIDGTASEADLQESAGVVDSGKIKSEFAMTIYRLANEPTGVELARFLKSTHLAPNLETLYKEINGNPVWRGNRAELLPYHQDVSLYQVDPAVQFAPNLRGALLRDALEQAATRLSVVGQSTFEEAANWKIDQITLNNVREFITSNGAVNRDNADMYYGLVRRAVTNAKIAMDSMGQAARDQYFEVVQDMLARTQDKGAADPRVAPAGEWQVTADTFGLKAGPFLELDALTSLDWSDVKTNLTKLMQGPVRLQRNDGAEMILDMTDELTLVEMMMDRRTSAFAKTVLFPTVRDINNVNVLQHYTDSSNPGSITKMLQEAGHSQMFAEYDTHAKKLRQATSYINFLESAVRHEALPGNEKERADAFLPITRMIAELLTAYTHGDASVNKQQQRERAVIEVADALKLIASLPAKRRPAAIAEIKARMIAQYQGDFRAIEALAEKTVEDEFLDQMWKTRLLESLDDVLLESENNINALETERLGVTDQARIDELNAEIELHEKRRDQATANYQALKAKNWGDLNLEYLGVTATINKYTLLKVPSPGMTDADMKAANDQRRMIMRDYLNDGFRKERFRDGDGHNLIEKLRYVTHTNPARLHDPMYFSEAEWDQMAAWCATVEIAEKATRSASDIAYAPLSSDPDAQINRYYDTSWGFLADGLFNPAVLKAAEYVAQNALFPATSEDDVVAKVTKTLLNPKRLGMWSDRIPVEIVKANRILQGASVGLAVPVGGIIPKTTQDQVGVGWISFAKPDDTKHLTDTQIHGPAGSTLTQLVDPYIRNKLENHFVKSIVLNGPGLPPEGLDITSASTFICTATDEVAQSGYTVLQMHRLQSVVEQRVKQYSLPQFTVDIEYVDVDKAPYTRDYANSIYFDGVGPGAALGSANAGPIAQSIFGTGGWSKVAQQRIFDFAGRGGSGFVATNTSPLSSALGYEDATKYPTISQQLLAKVEHMWNKSYDIGHFTHEDRPALHKMLKQRHVVVGQNASGEKVVMWSAEYISRQANADPNMPFVGDVQLVELNETVAATLLSDSTTNGIPDIVTRPELNASDMNPVPSLDADRLRRLGVTQLGQRVKWDDKGSPLFSQVALPKATVTSERGADVRSAYEEKIRFWTLERARVHAAALQRLGSLERAQVTRERNRKSLEQVLEFESLSWLMSKLNIPFPAMRDVASTEISRLIAKNIEQMTGGNMAAMFFEYDQGLGSGDLSMGVLSPDLINNDFENMNERPPTFGDVVTLKLDSFMTAAGGVTKKAEQQAQAVIRQFAGRGLTIVLASDKGDSGLRGLLTDWMQTGAIGYRPMNNSAHIFTPLTNDSDYGATRMALLSTLGSVQHYTGHGITVKFLSNAFGVQGANEQTTFVDFDNDTEITKAIHQLLPVAMVNTQGQHTREPMLFNIPVTDMDGRDQMKYVMEQTLLLLKNNPDVRKHIKSLTNLTDDGKPGDPNKADPEGVEQFRKITTPGGQVIVEPGVLDIDAAFDKLVAQFEIGEYPLGQGKELMIGQIVPVLAGDGKTIFFNRIGYTIPRDMEKQLSVPMDGQSINIAISSNKLNEGMTVSAPFTQVEDPVADSMGLSILGQYDMAKWGKWVEEGIGFKEGAIKLENYSVPNGLSTEPNNKARVTRFGPIGTQVKKRAVKGLVMDYRNLFAFTGISFKETMIDFFWGKPANGVRSEDEFTDLWAKTERILKSVADNDYGLTMEAVREMQDAGRLLDFVASEVNQYGKDIQGWTDVIFTPFDPDSERDPSENLAIKLITSLFAPGVRLEHVIEASGIQSISSMTSDAQITMMPAIFTDSLMDVRAPKLQDMLFKMANARQPRDSNGNYQSHFTKDFRFHQNMQPLGKDGKPQGPVQKLDGYVQVIMPLHADESSVAYSQASLGANRSETRHLVNVMNGALAARVETRRDPYKLFDARIGLSKNAIIRFDQPDPNGEFSQLWRMLTRGATGERAMSPWDKLTPMQWMWVKNADTRVGQYIRPIEKTNSVKWPNPDEARRKAFEFLTKIGLTQHMENDLTEVDYLVRQFLGRPAPAEGQVGYTDEITQELYDQVVSIMLENVIDNRHPLHGGAVPMERMHFWRKVFDSNTTTANGWAPVSTEVKGRTTSKTLAKSWDQWVTTLVGQMRDSNAEFHSMYRLELDGMWHTYQGSTGMMNHIGISTDRATELGLMDPDTNEYYLSLDVGQNALLRDPMLLDTMRISLDALAGYAGDYKGSVAAFVPQSPIAEQLKRQKDWLRGNKIPSQERMTFRQYMNDGAVYIESSRTTTSFFSGLVNLSIFTRLLNPALFVSAFIEVPARSAMEHATNLLVGTHIGMGGTSLAKMGLQAGVEPTYTEAEIQLLNELARQMGQSNKFLALMYEDITFRNFVERGHGGKISSKLEWMAAASARVTSDPKFGQKASSMAKRYIQGALEFYALSGTSFSVAQFVQKMEQNPLYVQDQSTKQGGGFSAHNAGMNRIAQVRSIKATALSNAIMSPIDAMTASGSSAWNATGHLLKIPFLFTRFNANALMALTGLNGLDQTVAMMLEGRKKPGFVANMGAVVRGESPDRANQYFDMSDVLEGLDLTRPFIRMGVTQTGLMAAMMMAQNMGLGGEDEEMRKRRALAKYLNGPLYLDPREMQNDFLTSDAMFLDNFSMFGLNTFFKDPNGRSAVVPHWIIRQFTAPMMGMQKFFETGNVKEIGWGFYDAVSVLPTSVTRLWQDADLTAQLLQQAAADEDLDVTLEAQNSASQLLIKIAGIYEKALIENSFVNAVRNGSDHYNRNPWLVPQTNETGDIVHAEGHNNMPLRTDALQSYVSEEGQVGNAYLVRDGMDAQAHAYAENNLTFSILASLFTGQFTDSTFKRSNMVVAEKSVPLPETSKAKAEALFFSAYAANPMAHLTLDEITRVLRKKYEDADIWWNQSDLEKEAEAIYAANSSQMGALTVFDDDAKEVVTKAGADGVFTSLANNLIDFDAPALQGLHVPWEMREEIDEEWATQLIQEGVNLGLTRDAATYRMRRMMNGDPMNPSVPGLRDIIYDTRIGTQPSIKYNQLNMTFMIGPDGKPWATPFARQNVAQAIGIPLPTGTLAAGQGMSQDDTRGKLVDDVLGINLGLHGLERKQQEPETRERSDDPLLRAEAKTYTPGDTGSAWKTYPKRSYTPYKRSGYSGGYSSGYSNNARPYFQRMQNLPGAQAVQIDWSGNINTNTPIIRRADVRRERISSERGRLKQWQ